MQRSAGAALARTGEPSMLASYMGKGQTFDEALADFAEAYADQNQRDHAALMRAVRADNVEAIHVE
ncbi:MAG: DUF2252 family protein [Deltaproteobacteria bacterium]|nr:DUF2252 family protein [Deltaproteobacteria bacterium]